MAWIPFIVGGDIHGDRQSKKANDAFFDFTAVWKPKIRVCAGDLYDFRPLRRGASAEEKTEGMQADLDAGDAWLEKFQPTHFLEGNHDKRLRVMAESGLGPLSTLAARGQAEFRDKLRALDCRWYPYHKRKGICRIGHLKVVHGYGVAGTYAARKHAQVYGSVLIFNFHSIQLASIEGIDNRIGRVCGCLCELDMDYNEAHLGSLMHRHGWAYGVLNDKTGAYHVWQAEQVNGKWLLPTGIREF